MKTYKICFKNPTQTVVAENVKEALKIFWDNFDTYNHGYPSSNDVVIEISENDIDNSDIDSKEMLVR